MLVLKGEVGTVYKCMDCPLCVAIKNLHLQGHNMSAYMLRDPIEVIFCMWQCDYYCDALCDTVPCKSFAVIMLDWIAARYSFCLTVGAQ